MLLPASSDRFPSFTVALHFKQSLDGEKKARKLLCAAGWGLRFAEHMEGDGSIIFTQDANGT